MTSKTQKISSAAASTLIITAWLLLSGYICIGGLSMVEAVEKVRAIEKRTEIALVREITNKYRHIDYGELPEHYITSINQKYKATKNKDLTFEEIEAMKDLSHVYWYYGVPGFSYIQFMQILPYTVLLFLVVGSAGLLGSIARMFLDHVRNILPIAETKYIATPISGFFMGLMVLAISYVIPSIFIEGNNTLNSTSVVLISFFAGVFSDSFYARIVVAIENLLKPKTSPEAPPESTPGEVTQPASGEKNKNSGKPNPDVIPAV